MSTVVLIGVIVPFALPVIVVILVFFYWLYLYFQVSSFLNCDFSRNNDRFRLRYCLSHSSQWQIYIAV